MFLKNFFLKMHPPEKLNFQGLQGGVHVVHFGEKFPTLEPFIFKPWGGPRCPCNFGIYIPPYCFFFKKSQNLDQTTKQYIGGRGDGQKPHGQHGQHGQISSRVEKIKF